MDTMSTTSFDFDMDPKVPKDKVLGQRPVSVQGTPLEDHHLQRLLHVSIAVLVGEDRGATHKEGNNFERRSRLNPIGVAHKGRWLRICCALLEGRMVHVDYLQ